MSLKLGNCMSKKNIYMVQFGTGTNVNLLPLAAGQLVSRLKQETELLKKYNLCEIIFRRQDPKEVASKIEDVFVIGLSCSLWNKNLSINTAEEVRKKFPEALIVTGGPSIPRDPELSDNFFRQHPYIDVICTGEGEEVFVALCNHYAQRKRFADIPGIIYRDRETGTICHTAPEVVPSMDKLPSPYVDGTFDDLYKKYSSEFSGIIWETNRGCPFRCTYCTWGNYASRNIREKPMEQVKAEIEWIGKNRINYIAMSDANFGIRERDLELVGLLAECKKKYGSPNFISVSWTKNSSDKVLKISKILKNCGIGFRVTLSLQSLNSDVIKAVKRSNIQKSEYQKIRAAYHKERYYAYTELILSLPLETYDSYLQGVEANLSESIFNQLYIYPCFLFPNTEIATLSSRKKYGIESIVIEGGYTKSKDSYKMNEDVEVVIGTATMPKEKWVDAFVVGYYTLALHDDRLAFFILNYLKKSYGIKITEIVSYMRKECCKHNLPTLKKSFLRLEDCAKGVQRGKTHLIEPEPYGGICFDPPEAIFLELLYEREKFYSEFLFIVESYLESQNINYSAAQLKDLYGFQEAVMAHPDGPTKEELYLQYDWFEYFLFAFNYQERELTPLRRKLKIIDPCPCNGETEKFLKNHFDVRGEPAFNRIFDDKGTLVFPPVPLRRISDQVSEPENNDHELKNDFTEDALPLLPESKKF